MQVDPALPWNGSVEGGVIQLREPLTLQQLLDGALDVVFKDGHDELNEGSFQIYPSDQRLYVGGSSLDYRITNVDTSSSSTQYSELILEKTPSADETLHSVSVHVPDVIVSPSLPWTDSTEEGIIQLRDPISFAEIGLGGLLNFKINDEGAIVDAKIVEGGEGVFIERPSDSRILYVIPRYSGSANNLPIEQRNAISNVSLADVELNERLPIWDGESDTVATFDYGEAVSYYERYVVQIQQTAANMFSFAIMKSTEMEAGSNKWWHSHLDGTVWAERESPILPTMNTWMKNRLESVYAGSEFTAIDPIIVSEVEVVRLIPA